MSFGDSRPLAVIGAGTMGFGIALAFARAGATVRLYDVDKTILERAMRDVQTVYRELARVEGTESEADAIRDRIITTTDIEEAVDGTQFVVEAVPEEMELKKEVFEILDQTTDTDTVLASNTSGLSITELGSATNQPERVVGTHWFNPPYIVPVVEVVRGDRSSDEAVDMAQELLTEAGKVPVVVEKDIPGFISNRIQLAMAHEAFSLLERGIATAEDIDLAVRGSFGFRLPVMGIFEKADLSGLDVHYDVASYLIKDLDRGVEPHDVLRQKVEAGDLGLKTGAGIYDWSDRDPEEIRGELDHKLLTLLECLDTFQG